MTNDKSVIDIRILGKEYKIGCERELERSLLTAAQYLDSKMREIRDQHNVIGSDKIAVLAALHITHDLLSANSLNKHKDQSFEYHLHKLTQEIDKAIS